MKPDPLDDTLASYARQPLPPGPEQLTADVWRDIELRRRKSVWSRLFPLLDWQELFAEPRLAVPALACALAIGILPAVFSARAHEEQRLARQSIHFNVFSTPAATQFTTLASNGGAPARPVDP